MELFLQYFGLLLVLCLCGSTLSLRCPERSSTEADTYKVKDRLDALTKSLGTRLLTSKDHKHKWAGSADDDVYDYTLQLCTPDNSFNAAFQVDKSKNPNSKVLLGRSNASFAVGGTDWLLLVYRDGKKYRSYCDGQSRETWVKVICDSSTSDPKLKVIEESRWKTGTAKKGCFYLLEINHKAVCSIKSINSSSLSGGAIFSIVMFSLSCAYLIFGFLFQRFIKGAKGWEQIPNYAFWVSFGNMTADGCDFVCRRPDHRSSTYKGMVDALDIDSSDDDKDDHLLPM